MLDTLFKNIGEKLQGLAVLLFILEVFSAILGGISLIAADDGNVIGPILLFCGPIVAWISSAILFSFGQLVEDVHAIRDKEGTTAEVRIKREEEDKAAEERAEREAEQLSVSDIESATSAFLKRRVSISDINCTLIYVIPKSTGKPKEMHLDMSVGDTEFTSLNLFFDSKRKTYFFKGRQLALDGAWRSAEEIFGFDVALFKRFNTEVDEED